MSDRVTFVIPTFERPRLLTRALRWYTERGYHVIVADGGSAPHATAGSMPGVTYLHQPGSESHVRIRNLVIATSTPYVVFCADDDLLIHEAVEDALDVLDADEGCASVQGRYVTFTEDVGRLAVKPAYLLSTEQDVSGPDVASRVVAMFDPYHQWSYAVHRRDTLERVYDDLVPRSGLVNANLIELLVALVTAANGEARILPRFYAAREVLPVSSGTVTATLADIVRDPSQAGELEAFLRSSIEHVMDAGQLGERAAKETVTVALNGYLDRFMSALQRSYDQSEADQMATARRLGGFPLFGPDPDLDRVTEAVVGSVSADTAV